jgi:hypothetical protein
MRNLALCLAGMLAFVLGPGAWADARPQARCEVHAALAERVMRHRQEANDLEATWRLAGLIRDPELSSVALRLSFEAYQRPRQASNEEREQAAAEFAEGTRAACFAREPSGSDQ